jgi:CRP/FNR family transcriptional regulator
MKSTEEKKAINGSLCECSDCIVRDLIFSHMTSEGTTYVCKTKTEVKYKKGEAIVKFGDEIESLICIKEGLIKIFRNSAKNSDQIISICKPFEFTYLLNLFSGKKHKLNITAIEDTTICYIPLSNINKMIIDNGNFAMSMLNKLSIASDNIIENYTNINQRNLRGRVAYILLFFSEKIYNSKQFNLPVSRKEIAELIGMTTENVIRIMSEFRQEGIIRIHTKEIEIKDYQRLRLIQDMG